MKIQKIIINLLILVDSFLFIYVSTKLDLFLENYSTLSLTTRSYFLFLFMGVLSGLIFYFVTLKNTNKKYALIVLASMYIGTAIPHDISYNLQGNLHLLNAYLGFIGLEIITYINVFYYNNKHLKYLYFISLFISVYFYCLNMCVNTIAELVIILSNLFIYFVIYNF